MREVGTGRPSQAAIDRLSAIPFYNAQLRTTCVATMVNAGHAENALPQSAKAIVNCRILPHDDPADIDRQLKSALGNDKISVRYINKPLASRPLR
jgi:acetylornithine deacetylase/succinyl-diaminopimelate desuccinylase-like protein